MPCWSAAPACTCGPWWTTSRSRAGFPRWPRRSRPSSTRASRSRRPPRTPCRRSTRSAAGRMEPTNRRTGGAGPRGDGRRRAARSPSSVRASRPTRPLGSARSGWSAQPDRDRRRIEARFAAMLEAGWSPRCGAWPNGPAASRARPARPSATARSWATSKTGVPLDGLRGGGRPAHPASSPAARRHGSGGTRASPGPRARRCAGAAGAGPRACTADRRRLREWDECTPPSTRVPGTTSSSSSTPRRRSGWRRPRCACWPTGTGASEPTGSSGSGPAARGAISPWNCATRTEARPR